MPQSRPNESIALRREPGHFVRSLAALLLRGGLGMIFLMSGFQKYRDMRPEDRPIPEPVVVEEVDVADAPAGDPSAESVDEDDGPELAEESGSDAPAEEGSDSADGPDSDASGDEGESASPPYPDSIRGMFAETWIGQQMPAALDLYTLILPFAEMAVGALLIVGILTTLTGFAAGLLLLSLLFGLIVQGDTQMYPNMLVYLLVDVGILWLSPVTSNYLSLDGLLFGWFWAPKDEEFVASEPSNR